MPSPPAPGVALPHFDADSRTLSRLGRRIAAFLGPPDDTDAILVAFQAAGWPACLANPLPPHRGIDARKRLRAALAALNRRVAPWLHFRADAAGIHWTFIVPAWDGDRDVFTYRGKTKHYVQEAENQTLILQEFEDQAWPEWIDNPLPPDAAVGHHRQLLSTVKDLNRTFKGWKLRFHADGKHDQVGWEPLR